MKKQDLLLELIWFIEPAFKAVNNDKERQIFLRLIGLNIETNKLDDLQNTINELIESLGKLNSSEDLDLEDLRKFFTLLKSIQNLHIIETNNFENNNSIDIIFKNLFDYLLIRYLEVKKPFIYALIHSLGVIKKIEITTQNNDFRYERKILEWYRITDFIKNNNKWLKEVYGWRGNPGKGDTKGIDYELIIKSISLILSSSGYSMARMVDKNDAIDDIVFNAPDGTLWGAIIPVVQEQLGDNLQFALEAGLKILPEGDFHEIENMGLAITPYLIGVSPVKLKLSDRTTLEVVFDDITENMPQIIINPKGIKSENEASTNPGFYFEFKYKASNNENIKIINIASSYVQASEIRASFGRDKKGDFFISGGVNKLISVFDFKNIIFLNNMILKPIMIEIGSLLIKWSFNKGVSFLGGNNQSISIPIHLNIGTLHFSKVALEIDLAYPKSILQISGSFHIGPLNISFDSVGFDVSLIPKANGIFGNYEPNLNFKPPTGVALSIDTEGIKGGGFLTINTATGEYRGGLVLGFRDKFTFRAVAIINTRLPGGEPGFSLFVMITADFQPVQLGFGFTLNAVGGLFGYNRTVEVDKLNELVRSGKASQLLFPPANADLPTIVNTAAEVYPVRVGNFVFGPMAKIGWGTPTIVMAEIALIIEVPDPVRVGMLGVIRVVLPDAGSPAPTIRLNMAFFAVVDFAKKMFSLQASLFDSKLLSVTLSGDFAVYMSWGQQRMFIFSAGGFHPAYKEAPPQLASMRRLNLTLIDDKKLKIAATTYLAITSNTVQFGSHIVLWCKFENVQINGQFWFDVLFQFDPFRFQAEMGLIASLSVDKNELAAIRIIGRLNGPGPWYVWGEAYIKVWFIEIKVEVEHSWGEEPPALAPKTANVKQMLLGEVQKKENWTTVPVPGSAISGISVRDLSKIPEIVLMPNCLLTFRQKVVPLGIEIQKFGEAIPQPGENKFEITGQIAKYDGAVEIHPANELFARANYLVLNDEEKLSYPSFEEFKGGITLGLGNNSAVQLGEREEYNYEYELKYLGQDQEKETNLPAFKNMFLQELKGSAAFRSPLSLEQNRPGREAIAPIIPAGGEYVIMRKADLTPLGERVSGDKRFKNFTEAEQYLKDLKIPQFADRYSIVSTLEL